jgi:hypothetical protein
MMLCKFGVNKMALNVNKLYVLGKCLIKINQCLSQDYKKGKLSANQKL